MTNSHTDTIVIGGDTETLEGKPMTLQFYSEDKRISKLLWVNETNVTAKLFKFLDSLPDSEQYAIYFHNLAFDLVELFYPMYKTLVSDPWEFSYQQWKGNGVYGKPSFLTLRNKRANKVVYLLDSMLWFQTSLDKAAQLVCPDLPKLKRVEDIGTKRFKKGDSEFEAYAMRDAEVCYHLGRVVQNFHIEFDLAQSVSLANMSSKIFKKHFLKYMIPQPQERECIEMSYSSYHGGKNNVVSGASANWHTDVAGLDISSAYPYAMASLPAFSNGKLYKPYKQKKAGRYPVPPYGVYCVSGYVKDCEWPSLFDHGFKPLRGNISNVCVQGLELNEAMRLGEFKPASPITGYYYDVDKERKHDPALKEFVYHFYALKQAATDPVTRYMYKIILNSLYGKFIQRREVVLSEDGEKMMLAGGLFHPFIASTITAHTRAYIHRLEHRFEAIHTATDGIYSKNTGDIEKRVAESNKAENVEELGKLEIEGVGDLLLLRNKLYILYTNDESGIPSIAFKGKYITKYAKHGYMGTLQELERLIATNRRKYTVHRPNTLKESVKRGLEPNKFQPRDYVLKIGNIGVK